jgi:glycosyltransferase involved in cell wall biosynthesis
MVLPSILKSVDLFLTVGDENERYFAHYGVAKERFHRVPFSIDSKALEAALANRGEIRERVRRQLGATDDAVLILTAGKLIPRKAQGDLIQAVAKLQQEGGRRAVVLIAGDGPERARLEGLAKPLGDAVKFLGFVTVDQLPDYYVSADVYAHPSSHDPHPLAISEALYCGLPVVASDRVGSIGPTDDVQVGRNGWAYRDGDVAGLAGALREMIADAENRRRASEVSRTLGLAHSADRCAALFVDGAIRALEGTDSRGRRRRAPQAASQIQTS